MVFYYRYKIPGLAILACCVLLTYKINLDILIKKEVYYIVTK